MKNTINYMKGNVIQNKKSMLMLLSNIMVLNARKKIRKSLPECIETMREVLTHEKIIPMKIKKKWVMNMYKKAGIVFDGEVIPINIMKAMLENAENNYKSGTELETIESIMNFRKVFCLSDMVQFFNSNANKPK